MGTEGRFKDRTVLVAIGLSGIVALAFCAGMTVAYYVTAW
jgi:hypothetical protein